MDKLSKISPDEKEILELREEIRYVIELMDITQNEAADLIAEELGYENFTESFKSDLKRCKKPEKLTSYLSALKQTENYQKVAEIRAKHEGDVEVLGKKQQKFLHQLSKQIRDFIDKYEVDKDKN